MNPGNLLPIKARARPTSEALLLLGAGAFAVAFGAAFVLGERTLGLGGTLGVVAAAVAIGVGLSRPYIATLAALALASFDALLVTNIETVTVRPSTILFGAALLGILLQVSPSQKRAHHDLRAIRIVLPVLWALLGLTAAHLLSYLAGGSSLGDAVPRFLVIVGGALVPVAVLMVTVTTPERFHNAVMVVVGALVAVSLYGLYQFSASYLGLPQGLEQTAQVAGSGRISGFSLEPGHFAAYLVTGLPLLVYLATGWAQRRTLRKLVPALVIITTLIFANARGGYVGGAAALAATFTFLAAAGCLDGRRVGRAAVVGTLVCVMLLSVSGLLGVSITNTLALQAEHTINLTGTTSASQDVSNKQRLDLYGAGYRMFRDHPVLGIGDGNAVDVLPRYGVFLYGGRAEGTLNSVPLEVAAETGVLGMCALVFLYVSLGRLTFRLPVRKPGDVQNGMTVDPMVPRMLLLGGFILLVVNGAFITWLWDLRLWTIVGLGLAGLAIAAKADEIKS